MARLPVPGSDQGEWGKILNDYLSQAHNTDGSLKDASIAETKLDAPTQAKLNAVGGATGATGPQGPAGNVGPAGATGAQGSAGTPGTPGAVGATGANGAAGATGATGGVGPAGAAGPQGATGPQGTAGTAGSTGATGPAGTNGTDGTSVTIAGSVANAAALPTGLGPSDAGDGYITNDDGHLHVWSGSAFSDVGTVRGPEGPTGPTGAAGTNGAVGATGATGPNSSTDLTFTRTTTTVTVESSTGNDAILPAADTNAGVMSAADKTKLNGIATGATVNATDAQLRDRSTHTGRQALSITTLTDGATIATDASLGNNFRVTLGGNRTLANPTNPLDGQMLLFIVSQDATGGRTLAFDTKFRFGTSLPSITLSSQPNKTDRIGVQYNQPSDTFDVISFAPGF